MPHRLDGRTLVAKPPPARYCTSMCGRFVQYSDPGIYASRFDAEACPAAAPRYNVAPTQHVLVVRKTEEGRRELVPLRWGLIPSWSKGPQSGYHMINARAETIDAKPAYRNAFKHRRCLIPAEGFYEWKRMGVAKTPFLIHRKDGEPLGMAGLWERWRGKDDETIESFTIIVTDANAIVRGLHDRMPVIISPADYAAWLNPENKDADGLRALLRPADPDPWTLRRVSRKVNSPKNDGPDLIEPVVAA
ncbi:MAG: SOS response-associated peptidase [Chromatiaceae bacterium]|jgi:putative SOS response-associated peptidase YedK